MPDRDETDGMVVQGIDPADAEPLVYAGNVHILDVRTIQEYESSGHLPGAQLLPAALVASAPAVLPRDGKPLLVYCADGTRCASAVRMLARVGFAPVLALTGGFAAWRGRRAHDAARIVGPSSWLLANMDLATGRGRVVDVASGAGRHALLLASAGATVRAIDRDEGLMARLRDVAERWRLDITTEVVDLESGEVDLGTELCDLVLVFNYLHRPLFPTLLRALVPGGLLLYETFTLAQASRGRPTNPDFLLRPGELRRLVAPLTILRCREGEFEGRMVASIAARKE